MMTFNPSSLNFYYSGVELPTQNVRCTLNLTEVLNNPRYTVSVSYNQSQIDWLKILDSSNNDITDVEQFGHPVNLKIKHDHNVVIQDGSYSAYVAVQFEGESGVLGNSTPYYDFGTFQVFLIVKAGISEFSVSPTSVILHLAKNNPNNPLQELIFTSPSSFIISGSDKFSADDLQLPVIIGSSTSKLSTTPIARTLPNGVYDYNLEFRNGRYYYGNLPTKLIVTNTNNLECFPSILNFKGIKDVNIPEWQSFYVFDPNNDVEITIPDFLNIEEISNDNGFKTYSAQPKESEIGEFNGEIIFTSGNSVVKITVTYQLQGLYNSNYERSYHFTQDSENLVMVKAVPDQSTFLRLSLDLKFYDFDGTERKINDRELDFFFFESKVEFDPGKLIHEMFMHYENHPNERFNELNRSTGIVPQYQFASIYFEVSEIDFSSLEVKNSYAIPTQFYIKGRRPVIWTDNRLLTHRESQVTRITRKSLITFNFVRYDSGDLILKLNGNIIDLPNHSSGDVIPQAPDVRIFGGIIKASDIENLKEYDLIELSFNNQKMYYQVEEEGINSVNVFYVNQWNLLSSFELTGEFIIDSDYERITTNAFNNWVETTKTLHTSKTQKFKINSGFIPLENMKVLDEMMTSKKVFIVINNFTYEARPISSKLNNQTSKNNLVDRQLEFELKNQNNDSFYVFGI
ncbi:hypothetical protein ACTS9E_15060 [Empedobacter brevis]